MPHAILRTAAAAALSVLAAAPAAGQTNCSTLLSLTEWVIDACASDSHVTTTMQVVLDGLPRGNAAVVRIYHRSEGWPGTPQVMVLYSSGYVRLKQNADPTPPIPFGSSFVLGPAYWSDGRYYHNPQLSRLELDTSWLPNAPLRMHAVGALGAFDVTYEMALPPPRDRQTRLHVRQTHKARSEVTIDSTRMAAREAFKLAQVSSMFINQTGTCAGGQSGCHDADAVRYLDNSGEVRVARFSDVPPPRLLLANPLPLGATWVDTLHSDDAGWQGNTPNVRIALDETAGAVWPQGRIEQSADVNNDNVGVWLYDESAVRVWNRAESGAVGYWLLAQDNPPDPAGDLGLRPGVTMFDFENSAQRGRCSVLSGDGATADLIAVTAATGVATGMHYNLGSQRFSWAQIKCEPTSGDLSAFDHLRFDWRGSARANTLEVGLIASAGAGDSVSLTTYRHVTHRAWWGPIVVPFRMLDAADNPLLHSGFVKALLFSVKYDAPESGDEGGEGTFALDNIGFFNAGTRQTPADFESAGANVRAARSAAAWAASQQQSNGLLKSWLEESACLAYTYDQALGLIMFSREGMWPQADRLARALAAAQNTDGSWLQARYCDGSAAPSSAWEGDIAWSVYALNRYLALGGTQEETARGAARKAATWLTTRLDSTGCLATGQAEATIDIWLALNAAGAEFQAQAESVKQCLLLYYWDPQMGRFKAGRNDWRPYTDNLTWGALFLRRIGESEKARRALSYARMVLETPARGGQLLGLDGNAGPWAVWNEGTAQYVAAGGAGAKDLLVELLAQQGEDGSMPAAPDEFAGGGVWDSRWHGIAPAAWLYFALTGEPVAPIVPLNSADFRQAPVAPGSLMSVFGSGLAEDTGGAASLPLPARLSGASVTIDGYAAPLIYASPTQLNVQAPFEVPPGIKDLVVSVNGAERARSAVGIIAAAPGIFQTPKKQCLVQNVSRPDKTAAPGDYITVYLTGQGVVQPGLATGDAAPLTPLSRPVSLYSASLGGQAAEVQYLGLTPGFAGLGQANILVPGVSSGSQPLAITVGGATSAACMVTVSTE